MAYATTADIQSRLTSQLSTEQLAVCAVLLDDAAVMIDAYNSSAAAANKKVVSCRMVIRAIGNIDSMPVGANQGTVSALGYSQTWTFSAGSVGELYLSKSDKKTLGVGDNIGASNPFVDLVGGSDD